MAAGFVALGNTREAFMWLERGYKEHDASLVSLGVDPEFDDLRSDSRFTQLVRRIAIPTQ